MIESHKVSIELRRIPSVPIKAISGVQELCIPMRYVNITKRHYGNMYTN